VTAPDAVVEDRLLKAPGALHIWLNGAAVIEYLFDLEPLTGGISVIGPAQVQVPDVEQGRGQLRVGQPEPGDDTVVGPQNGDEIFAFGHETRPGVLPRAADTGDFLHRTAGHGAGGRQFGIGMQAGGGQGREVLAVHFPLRAPAPDPVEYVVRPVVDDRHLDLTPAPVAHFEDDEFFAFSAFPG